MKNSNLRNKLILFFGSFSAISAQLLFIKSTETLVHNETLSYTSILFLHYFSLALGSKKNLRISLIWSQTLLGILTPALISLGIWLPASLILSHIMSGVDAALLTPLDMAKCVSFNLASAALLGFLHGTELPSLSKSGNFKLGDSLFASYLGALIGFTFTPLYLIPRFGILPTASILAFAYCINILSITNSLRLKVIAMLMSLAPAVVIHKDLLPMDQIRRAILYSDGLIDWPEERFSDKSEIINYLKNRVEVTLIESPVQSIEWIKYSNKNTQSFRLFLNGEFQFDSLDEKEYHHDFLIPIPESLNSILIIGAGDGLLARQVLNERPEVQTLDWIEVDQQVLDLAKNNSDLKQLNEGSLSHPKVKIQIGDAFYKIKDCSNKYDAILLDLPYPSSLALSRIYSREFYTQLKRCLASEDSMIVLDAPTEEKSGQILRSTLLSSGYQAVIAYGKGNTYFFASPRPDSAAIDRLKRSGIPRKEIELEGPVNELMRPMLPLIF